MPIQELVLQRFGGLYTEADQRSLPLGASPRNHDINFLVAGIGPREGLTKVFTGDANQGFPYIKSTHIIPPFSAQSSVTLYQEAPEGMLKQLAGPNIVPFSGGDSNIISDAIATSENFENVEYIALSNLGPEVITPTGPIVGLVTNGYDQPRTWNGSNVGRVSQAGPSAPIGVTSTGTSGGSFAAGVRYALNIFIMFDGSLTPAGPPVKFTLTGNETGLVFAGIQTGPANVVGRIIALTLANAGVGGPYFYIPQPIPATGISSTVLNDNTTTGFTAVLTDTAIGEGIDVTVVGNNELQMREIGEYVKAVQYAGRMFYLGERVKVDNLPGMSFDGGSLVAAYPWGFGSGGAVSISLVRSPIYGTSFRFQNTSGGMVNTNPLSPAEFIFRTCGLDPFGVPTLQNNIDYSVRISAYTDAGGAGCFAVLSLNNGVTPISRVNTGPLGTTPQEYILDFELSGLNNTVGSLMNVFPANLPAGGSFFIDRIEIFPTEDPIYSSQLSASYIQNPQAVDSQTGALDVSLYTTDPLTNCWEFLNVLYMQTASRTFSSQDTAGSEPSGWAIQEISEASGCFGPLADAPGEAYRVYANRYGFYIFDGGNPIKISQEIQQLWNYIYQPSANRVWVKNDLYQQRFLIGVPMITPNPYLPDAPANAAPTTPNVILMCSYLILPIAAAIADSPGVRTSAFTGALLAHDMTRKWTAWYIASPYADWVNQSNGPQQFWLSGNFDASIYKLDPTTFSDNFTDPVGIPQTYIPYGFSDEMTNQGLQLGNVRKMYPYVTMTIEGAGDLEFSTFPETLSTPYARTQPPVPLTNPMLGDVNLPMNETGNFMFIQLRTDGEVGSYFNLRRVVMGCTRDAKIPVSGR